MAAHLLDLHSRYELTAGVKFRSEDFGGIVYKRQTDQLIFLNSPLAIELLSFAGHGTVQEVISGMRGDGAQQDIQQRVLTILASLQEMGIIYELAG